MQNNFEASLTQTLKWEGGFSNDKGDPGGPTDYGVTWAEYNRFRRSKGLTTRSVRLITMDEVQEIYKQNYWDAIGADNLAIGVDYACFDLAVNNGVSRAKQFLAKALRYTDGSPAATINAICDYRLSYDEGLGKLWRLFGAGWGRRISGVRRDAIEETRSSAHAMAEKAPAPKAQDRTLRLGSAGPLVRTMQTALRAKGYPVGGIDGIYGRNTQRAVTLFQLDINSAGERGAWLPEYNEKLQTITPYNAARRLTTEGDLHAQGDPVIAVHRLMKAFLAWAMLLMGVGQGAVSSQQVADVITATQGALEPAMAVLQFMHDHRHLFGIGACLLLFFFVRYLSYRRVREYAHFDFQGAFTKGGK